MNSIELKNHLVNKFKDYELSLNGEKESFIHQIRKDAIEKFFHLDFPVTSNEEWKYTNLSSMYDKIYNPVNEKIIIEKELIEKNLFENFNSIVFVNGILDKELSNYTQEGYTFQSLHDLALYDSDLLENLGKRAPYKNNIFTAMNTAFLKDGAYLVIEKNKVVEKPIQLLFVTTAGNNNPVVNPRVYIVAEENSEARVIEHFISLDEGVYVNNVVTEVYVKENAVLDHTKIQEENKNCFHIQRFEVEQDKNSTFRSHLVSFGGAIARNDYTSKFNGEGGESTMNGLFMIDKTQLFDSHTLIDHAKPHCNSYEHYKGILDDKSRGVFNGKVIVRQDAQKTNAFQQNNNIILSNEALVNTKPQLEIFADDVKCSHGATIGQLDEDALFYLKSRGIGSERSLVILLHAFASDVVKTIKMQNVRDYIEEIINQKFNIEN